MKYKCNICNIIFEKLYQIPAETFYGVSDLFDYNYGHSIGVCPSCHDNDIKEIKEDLYDL